jgi:hypothetical protein
MPSPFPEQRFQRLLSLARFDAISLIVVAGPAALWALATREWFTAACGLAVTLCGVLEWREQRRLARGCTAALGWMCVAQLVCLAAILLYAHQLAGLARADRILALLPDFTREQLFEVFDDNESAEAFLLSVQHLMVAAIAIVAILYQGGMAFFYLRSRALVQRVLAEPPVIAATPPPLPR